MRQVVTFTCEGDRLFGTVDQAPGATGILIVSGGNEVRCGAHRGMALMAQVLALDGVPVFRFDRRGVGDSEGQNGGYASSASDIAAALDAFRREQPQITRVVAFGNCDAATALVLLADGFDALVLANPWLGDEAAPPPPAALRANYLRRLGDRAAWRVLLSGDVRNHLRGLWQMFGRPREQPLTARIVAAIGRTPTTIVLAGGDRTAQVFAVAVPDPVARVVRVGTASHSFAGQTDALRAVLLDVVREVGRGVHP